MDTYWYMFIAGLEFVAFASYLLVSKREKIDLRFVTKCTLILLLFGLLDVISTVSFMVELGPQYESNLFLRFLVENLGMILGLLLGFIYIKFVVVFSVLVYINFSLGKKATIITSIFFAFINIFVSYINFSATIP